MKVLGELDATDGTGLLGRATGSGQTYGKRGEASSTSGYGLSTPDDARVCGIAELGTLGANVTGGTTATDLLGRGLTVDRGQVLVAPPLPSSTGPSEASSVLLDIEGDGSSSNPYVITNDQELQAMKADPDANYVLGRDINPSLTGHWNNSEGFDAIDGAIDPVFRQFRRPRPHDFRADDRFSQFGQRHVR